MSREKPAEILDKDSVWKELLEKYLKEFMDYFFPEASSEIDWERGYKFLDKELQKVVRAAVGKRRYVDKLVQVWLKNGKESWVLLHIEVQGQWEEEFAERMYIYQYRIFDRYKKRVASFVVLVDENPNWRPSTFGYELLGSKLKWDYQVVKLLDYQSKWAELEQDNNPFSLVVMAHLKLQETKDNVNERYQWKRKLVRMLYERGYSKENILELFRFLDWLLILPEDLEEKLSYEIEEYERSELMPYVTNIERHLERRLIQKGLELGKQEGRQEGERFLVIRLLKKRLGELDAVLVEKLNALTIEQLERLGESLLDFQNKADLEQWLANNND